LTKNSSAMEEGGDGRRSCGVRVGEKQKKRAGKMIINLCQSVKEANRKNKRSELLW
jgi:hypothetical protein